MFNVTVLRMKDIMRFFIGIAFILLIIYFSKLLYKPKGENKIAKELADSAKILTSNNMSQCLDYTILAVATVNDKNETNLLSGENEENIAQSNMLENILKTQISSLKAMEITEKNMSETEAKKTTNGNNNSNEEKIELARNRIEHTSCNK